MKQVYSAWLTRWVPRPLAALGLLLATAGAVQAQTTTYTYSSSGFQYYTVPAGVTSINVVASGASGGTYGNNTNYSYEGMVQATLPVTPGSVLTVVVGGRGGNSTTPAGSGGYNGGGQGTNNGVDGGGGGGGATDIRIGGTALTDRVLVAGGGGGSGSDSGTQGSPPATGGRGGNPVGGNGDGPYAGGGATQSGPGVAGNGGSTYNGSYGYGGNGYTGPGGGGGYYGGGGTSQSGGGGGGSSAVLLPGSTNISYPIISGTRTAHDGVLAITPSSPADLTVNTTTTIQAGTYNNITVTSTGVGTLAGNVTVAGAFVVQSGGTLNDGCNVISGAGSFTLTAGGTLGICSAAGITSSGATGAVQVTGARSFSTDASYVYNGTAAQVTGTGLPAQVRNLSTTNASTVTLTSPTSATQLVTVGSTGNLALNGQALTLLSTSAGTALVVNSGAGVVSGSTAVVQRYIDGALNSGPGYRHFSVPVTGTTLADFATSSFTPVVNPAYNASPTPGTVTPFPTLFTYNQNALASANNNLSAFDKGWLSPNSLTNSALPGLGYCLNLSAGQVVDLVGTLYNTTLTVGMSRTTGATAADGGWALIGNPYPAPLDLSLVQASDRQNLDAATYVVQSTGQYAGGYRAYVNGVSTSATNNPLLALGQGFFARVSAGQTTGSFTFRNTQRVTTYASQAAFQRTTADLRPQVRLELAGAGLADGWVAYAETGATPAFDSQLDAGKLPNSTGLNLSSVAGTDNLAIDGQPAFTASTMLPLAVGVPAAGTYSLSATTLNNLPAGLAAYLRDSQTGQTVLLTAGTSYSFSVTAPQAATLLTGRFTLLLRPQAPLATVAALAATDVTVYPNPAHASFTVALPGVTGASTVQAELFNALGQVVRRQAAALPMAGTALTLTTADLAAGVYVLRLQAGTTTLAKRMVIQ